MMMLGNHYRDGRDSLMHAASVPQSDRDVQAAVEDELAWTPQVNAARVGVSVNQGVVVLSGEVDSASERIAAKNAALRVAGVSAVANEMVVSPRAVGEEDDVHLAEAVEHALQWADYVPAGSVQAEVKGGRVILTGVVEWNYQREAARKAVERLCGIREVDSRIALSRRASAADTAERIGKAFARNAVIEAARVEVAVEGTRVTLSGRVRSWAEREQAEKTAWASPHVSDVHNRIVIDPRPFVSARAGV